MNKKMMNVLIAVLLIFITAVVVIKVRDYKEARIFTQEKWDKQPDRRHLIVKDLLKKHNLYGMSKVEIINLIGEPALTLPSGVVRRLDDKKEQIGKYPDRIYYLTEGSGKPEGMALYIGFDEAGKVVDYSLVAFST